MGYLNNSTRILDAILTRKGREMLSKGQLLNVDKFALGDDEVDYALWDTSHQSGTDYYGAVIENLPFLEPFDDPDTIMKYRLVTRPYGTAAMCEISSIIQPIDNTGGVRDLELHWYDSYLSDTTGNAAAFPVTQQMLNTDTQQMESVTKWSYFTNPIDEVKVQTNSHQDMNSGVNNYPDFGGESYTMTILDSSVAFFGPTTVNGTATQPGDVGGVTAYNTPTTSVLPSGDMTTHWSYAYFGQVINVPQTVRFKDGASADSGLMRWGGDQPNSVSLYGQRLNQNQHPGKTKIIVTGNTSGAVMEFDVTVKYHSTANSKAGS